MGVSEPIRKAIEELGFVQPMPVQEEVIPYLLGNRNDVIALAQTGTGKTAAFGIPLLQRIDTDSKETQAIVLSPTRELCLQTSTPSRAISPMSISSPSMVAQVSRHRFVRSVMAHRSSWLRRAASST